MPGTVREVLVRFLGDPKPLAAANQQAANSTKSFEDRVTKLGEAVTAGYGVGKIIQFGKESVQAATEDAQAQAVLAQQLKATTGASDSQVASVEQWINKTQNATGVLDDELRPALANLLRATHDVDQAQKLLTVSMDVSKGTGKDLEAISLALAKAHGGNVTALQKLGVETKNADGTTRSFKEIIDQLTATFGGATAAAADTAAGRMAILRARMSDLQENVGTALLPVVEKLAGALGGAVGWFNHLSPAMQGAITQIVVFGAGGLGAAKAIGSAAEAVKGLSSALNFSSGAMGTVGALLAAGTGLYLLYANAKRDATAKTKEFTSALFDETGALQKSAKDIVVDHLKDYAETASKVGTNLKEVADVTLQGGKAFQEWQSRVIAAAGGNKDLEEQVRRLQFAMGEEGSAVDDATRARLNYLVASQQMTRDQAYGAIAMSQQADAAKLLFAAMSDGVITADELVAAQQHLYASGSTATINMAGLAEQLQKVSTATDTTTTATDDQTDATDRSAESNDRLKQSIDDRISALDSLYQATVAQFSSELRLERAQSDTEKSVSALHDLEGKIAKHRLEKGVNAADAMAEATRKVKDDILGEAAAAVQHAEDQAKANGETLTAQQRAEVYRDKLEELKAKFPELAAVVQGYIDKINEASKPRTFEFNYRVNSKGQVVRGDLGGGKAGGTPRASGGPTIVGNRYTVGEYGLEELELYPGGGGRVTPLGPRTRSRGGSKVTYIAVYPERTTVTRGDLAALVSRYEALYA